MATYRVKLIKKEEVADGTMAFYFEKPKRFNFLAGQYINVNLINPPETDKEGNSRFFSIASAPYEDFLIITTRMRDTAFKRVLKNSEIGTEFIIDGPYGYLYLHKDSSVPAVFLAGGIGITPFYSIIKENAHTLSPFKIFLFYSNRSPKDAAFLNRLGELEKENPNFKLINTMTDDASWQGETGFINIEMIKKYLPDVATPIYYTAGPPKMAQAMMNMLKDAGIKEKNIISESFSGY